MCKKQIFSGESVQLLQSIKITKFLYSCCRLLMNMILRLGYWSGILFIRTILIHFCSFFIVRFTLFIFNLNLFLVCYIRKVCISLDDLQVSNGDCRAIEFIQLTILREINICVSFTSNKYTILCSLLFRNVLHT